MTSHRLDIYPGGRGRSEWPIVFFAIRRPKLLAVGFSGWGRGIGINLHRDFGLSITGIPSSGGTTFALGALRKRCEEVDADRPDWRPGPPDATIRTVGPVMVRVGSDF